jgi:hypothetical protein
MYHFQDLLAFYPKNLYNDYKMTAATLRLFLVVTLIAMDLLAMLYLRRRPLTFGQYAVWGLFALLVPALGPFLVILSLPGGPRRRRRMHRLMQR